MLSRLSMKGALGTAGGTTPAYQVIRHLGTGGAGRVYLSRIIATGEPVVVKMPRTWRLVDDLFCEARYIAGQRFPHVARLRDVDTCQLPGLPFDLPFLVMDAYERSLYSRLDEERRIDPLTAIGWIEEIARGLQATQLIHRDLKPENILLDRDDHAWICDFGLAIPANPVLRKSIDCTITGVVGTLIYMSPEQIYEAADIDIRSDIYALGLLLFELLTGRPAQPRHPGHLSDEEYLELLLEYEVRWQEVRHPACADIVRTCTQKSRRLRYPDYWSLLDALHESRALVG